jgi:hypothetical protein
MNERAMAKIFRMWHSAGVRLPNLGSDDERRDMCRLWASQLFFATPREVHAHALTVVHEGARFMPSLGEFVKRVAGDDRPMDDWEAGWSLMLRQVNYYNPPTRHTDDDDVEGAIQAGIRALGGYRAMCTTDVTCPAARAAFRDAFKSTMGRQVAKRAEKRAALAVRVHTGALTADQAREALFEHGGRRLLELPNG